MATIFLNSCHSHTCENDQRGRPLQTLLACNWQFRTYLERYYCLIQVSFAFKSNFSLIYHHLRLQRVQSQVQRQQRQRSSQLWKGCEIHLNKKSCVFFRIFLKIREMKLGNWRVHFTALPEVDSPEITDFLQKSHFRFMNIKIF